MGKKVKIRVGSRESLLAVKQAEIVMDYIKKYDENLETELITFKTKGDKILDRTLDKIGGKGLFIKELEVALLNNEIDIAVHSYKDMPYEENSELPIVALSKREEPWDVLVLPKGIKQIDINKPIGSSSLRRNIQFTFINKNMKVESIRGNVLTRLEKLDRGDYSAIILAQAGINRLSLGNRISKVFTLDEIIPSASQGILAVQGRKNQDYSYLEKFNCYNSLLISNAERSFLKTLDGGCSSPIAAYAYIDNNKITLQGMYVNTDNKIIKGSICGNIENGKKLGEDLGKNLKYGEC